MPMRFGGVMYKLVEKYEETPTYRDEGPDMSQHLLKVVRKGAGSSVVPVQC
jgi:hypothetical protein